MNKNKFLLLFSSIGAMALLTVAAVDENFLKQWRVIQSSVRLEGGPIEVRLRQIVNPGLKVSDRCVSCHVGMAPGEQGIAGEQFLSAHKPVVHDPADFGCTICHSGQGAATEKAAAHGDLKHWPEPMLPHRYSYAGCGTCHTPLNVPNLSALRKATSLFERYDCLTCHRVDGRGGVLRPGIGEIVSPDLSRIGFAGYDQGWYEKHLLHYEQASEGFWKSSFGPINEADREALKPFLSTRVGAPKLIEAKALFNSSGCLGCHKVSGTGGDDGPDLSRSGERDPGQLNFSNVPGEANLSNWLAEHFRSPVAVVQGSKMPALALSKEDIDLLTMYVLSLRRRVLPGNYLPRDRVKIERFGAREFSSDGATIFGTFCAGCHGPSGKGARYGGTSPFPAIGGSDFLKLASDEFIVETITRGRPGRRMPAWGEIEGGLKPDEIKSLVVYLRRSSGQAQEPDAQPKRWAAGDAALGNRLYIASCAGCHGDRGQGAEGPALNNKVFLSIAADSFLVETVRRGRIGTAMEGFEKPSATRRTLSQKEIESIIAYIRAWEGR